MDKNNWINIKDRLPDRSEDILVIDESYGLRTVEAARYDKTEKRFFEYRYEYKMDSPVMDGVTDWQSLPELPVD